MKGPENLNVREALSLSTEFLARKGSPSARLDAQLLISHVLKLRRLDLYLSPERPLTVAERDELRALLVRRGKAEPVAYLTGRREFFGMEFSVTPDVLIPRPETESIVDAALEFLSTSTNHSPRIADIGTGSGAIACALAARTPHAVVTATDISAAALDVARCNAEALGLDNRITFVQTDILDDVIQPADFELIVSNPPYIAESESGITDPGARLYEPLGALFSGADGTDCTFKIIERTANRLAPGGILIIETGTPRQTALVAARLGEHFGIVAEVTDPAGYVRGLKASRGPD